jgi:hypothetical protein
MSDTATFVAAALRHHFTVRLEPDPNALARLLGPFVIHDVLPDRLDSARSADALTVRIEFTATDDIARRLADRMAAMVPVHEVNAIAVADAAAA